MKQINNYISEKLHINKDYKKEKDIPEIVAGIINEEHNLVKKSVESWIDTWDVNNVEIIANNPLSEYDMIDKDCLQYIKYDKKRADELESKYISILHHTGFTFNNSIWHYADDMIEISFKKNRYNIFINKI